MIHFHKYKIIESQAGVGSSYDILTLREKENIPMTSILMKCEKCGKLKTDNIQGKWEIQIDTQSN